MPAAYGGHTISIPNVTFKEFLFVVGLVGVTCFLAFEICRHGATRERICIVTPYFIPDDPLKQVLARRAREGIDVRLLLPGRHIGNQSTLLSAQNHYDDLIEAGVRIYEYRPILFTASSWLSRAVGP